MKVGSLFSGIGGFDLGFQRAGFECAWQVEKDRYCLNVLERHFPDVKRFKDVRDCGKQNLEPVDLICGGFPCQDLSIAGRREGLAGERSGLWFEFARVIDELEPRWIVIENVTGLLSSNGGRDFAIIIRWLAVRGYGICWRILDAQYFGLAQHRERVFIVGSFRSGRSAQILFDTQGLPRSSKKGAKKEAEIAHTLRGRSASSGKPKPGRGGEDDFNLIANTLTSHHGRNAQETFIPEVSKTLANSKTTDHYDDSQQTYLVTKNIVRRLTPTECERLQGFPDGWTAGLKDSTRYRQLGNAVAVPVTEWIAKRIRNVEI